MKLVNTEEMPFLKGDDVIRRQQNIQILRDNGLIKTEDSTWTLLSITTPGIRLVENPRELNREFPVQHELPEQTKKLIDTVETLLTPDYPDVWNQFRKAREFLYNVKPPDYLNSVKEAVGAVEGFSKIILYHPKDTLSDLLPEIRQSHLAHPAMGKIIEAIYAVRGDEPGIGHGAYVSSNFEYSDAEFMLNISASLIIYLARKEMKQKSVCEDG